MLSRTEEKLVRGLARRKTRAADGLFLAEGVRVVEELLAAGIVPRLALVSSTLEDTERGRDLAARLGGPALRQVSPAELDRLADTTANQGVLVVAPIPPGDLGSVDLAGDATILVLDGIQDPGNLGTLARSAAAFGCAALVCLPGTVDPWNPKVVRAAAGALFRMPVVQPELEDLAGWLKEHDVALLGAEADGRPIGEVDLAPRVALVVGNEGAGLGDDVRSRCDALVSVPMRGRTESLNVAVAAGILLYLVTERA